MHFHLLTIFPEIFESYFRFGILKRALEKKLVEVSVYNLRDFAAAGDPHRSVDDTPYGGGPGMVLKVEPIFRGVEFIKQKITREKRDNSERKILTILTSARGAIYRQAKAQEFEKQYTDLIIICGRYEGVDERVAKHIADEEISIGEYILSGGELPALVIVDSVTRLVSGVLGNTASLQQESYNKINGYDYPVYTKPAVFKDWSVPSVLLSGNHQQIERWRLRQAGKRKEELVGGAKTDNIKNNLQGND